MREVDEKWECVEMDGNGNTSFFHIHHIFCQYHSYDDHHLVIIIIVVCTRSSIIIHICQMTFLIIMIWFLGSRKGIL